MRKNIILMISLLIIIICFSESAHSQGKNMLYRDAGRNKVVKEDSLHVIPDSIRYMDTTISIDSFIQILADSSLFVLSDSLSKYYDSLKVISVISDTVSNYVLTSIFLDSLGNYINEVIFLDSLSSYVNRLELIDSLSNYWSKTETQAIISDSFQTVSADADSLGGHPADSFFTMKLTRGEISDSVQTINGVSFQTLSDTIQDLVSRDQTITGQWVFNDTIFITFVGNNLQIEDTLFVPYIGDSLHVVGKGVFEDTLSLIDPTTGDTLDINHLFGDYVATTDKTAEGLPDTVEVHFSNIRLIASWTGFEAHINNGFRLIGGDTLIISATPVVQPTTYYVYLNNALNVVSSTTEPSGSEHVLLTTVRYKSVATGDTLYYQTDFRPESENMVHNLYDWLMDFGILYESGLRTTVDLTTGAIDTVISGMVHAGLNETSLDSLSYPLILLDDETIIQSINSIATYSDGTAIGVNKWTKELLGRFVSDSTGTLNNRMEAIYTKAKMMLIRMGRPTSEYTSESGARADISEVAATGFGANYNPAVVPIYYVIRKNGDPTTIELVDIRRNVASGGGGGATGGVTDHGALTGLADNDHPQYLLTTDSLDTKVNLSDAQDINGIKTFPDTVAIGTSSPVAGFRLTTVGGITSDSVIASKVSSDSLNLTGNTFPFSIVSFGDFAGIGEERNYFGGNDTIQIGASFDSLRGAGKYYPKIEGKVPGDTASQIQKFIVYSPVGEIPVGFAGIDSVSYWLKTTIAETGTPDTNAVTVAFYLYESDGTMSTSNGGPAATSNDVWTYVDMGSSFGLWTRYSKYVIAIQLESIGEAWKAAVGDMRIYWKVDK